MRPAGVILLIALLGSAAPAGAVDYVTDVKPLLQKHCYSCHSGLRAKSGLRLDHISFIRAGGDRGSSLAEKAADSVLLQALDASGDVEQMPAEAKPLSAAEIDVFRQWIDAGAPAPDEPLPADPSAHWSFQKPVRPPLPEVASAAWGSHPVDRFIAAKHEQQQLQPSGEAPKNLLLRRVYLDLIGLPPTHEEMQAFLADASPDAYEKVVDRLLASPQYGERWGRHWMDVWRYSDWDGYAAEVRESQPHIWRWRDWIVESLNADRPYDEMIAEMLAADEIKPLDESAARATGYLVRNWFKFNRNTWLENTVEHTSKAFLGITINCARCHDHMYDPILQTEYYQFRAFFEPHDVRTDRIPGQSDTTKDGLVRVFDAHPERQTFLFVRGNEAKPEKDEPLAPAVPRALGGDPLVVAAIDLPAEAYYPGLRGFVQQESLAAATAAVEKAEKAMSDSSTALADARKKLADMVAANAKPAAEAPPAGNGAPETEAPVPAEPAKPEADKDALTSAVTKAESGVSLAESNLLAAAAELVAVRAKIAADNARFSATEEDNPHLAREASRAERVAGVERARRDVLVAEQELAAAKAEGEKAAKKAEGAEKKLADARKAREDAQAALGKIGEDYVHFGSVYPAKSTGRRAALARWIASKNNPLTARVAINQIWMRHFGAPLVPTVFDFGLNGTPPTHPELLDWLAVELMENGWHTKPIHRLLVTSTAYRMESTARHEQNLARDAGNAYLWRANPRRMEAELVRDSALHVAGSLDLTLGGPELDQNAGMKTPRRSLYFRSSKEKKMEFLDTFDRANVTDCYRRSETVIPQQALAMVNSSLSLAQARTLAGKLAAELATQDTPESQEQFVATAFDRILCRLPTSDERQTCLEFLHEQSARLGNKDTLAPFAAGEENPVKPADDPRQRARENLVHVLLNHNDFLTIR